LPQWRSRPATWLCKASVLNAMEDTMWWLSGEPRLRDVLSDPVVHALMERDDVDPDDFQMFLEDVGKALKDSQEASQA
jgi:hypothetical protein